MAKKILCVTVLTLALVCTLASCDVVSSLLSTHTHDFGEWETVKAATCTKEGSKERYCPCGEKQTGTIGVKEHEYGEWSVSKEATFTEVGEEIRTCACGDVETRSVPKKPATLTLTKEQYLAEIEPVFRNVINQKTLWVEGEAFDEEYCENIIFARYYDGNEFFIYQSGGDGSKGSSIYAGKVINEYYMFEESIVSSNVSRDYSVISKSDIAEMSEELNEDLSWWFEFLSFKEDSDYGFECTKTVSDKTVYTIEAKSGNETYNVTVTVKDGLITEVEMKVIEGDGYITDTYEEKYHFYYDMRISLPDISDYS